MTKVRTEPSLLEELSRAAGRPMTAQEVREQRISFVMSAVTEGSEVTRAEIGRIIDEREGSAA